MPFFRSRKTIGKEALLDARHKASILVARLNRPMETRMVDTVTATSLALDTTLSLQLQSGSVAAGTNTGGGSGDRFGAAVLINLKTHVAITLPPPDPKGEQALATLKAASIEAAGFSKKDAADRLTRALNELKILKLLGGGINGAKQANDTATTEIAVAASEYAQSGGAVPADVAAASAAPDATASTATPTTAAGNTDAPAAPPPATAPSAVPGDANAFFQAANEALSELRRYLHQILPALETSHDKKTRNAAHKAKEDFDKAAAETLTAQNLHPSPSGAVAPAPVETVTATIDTSVTLAVAAASYQPLNLSA
jgi:DNA-binding ferritin-like protein